jgi:hypothetical protein
LGGPKPNAWCIGSACVHAWGITQEGGIERVRIVYVRIIDVRIDSGIQDTTADIRPCIH